VAQRRVIQRRIQGGPRSNPVIYNVRVCGTVCDVRIKCVRMIIINESESMTALLFVCLFVCLCVCLFVLFDLQCLFLGYCAFGRYRREIKY